MLNYFNNIKSYLTKNKRQKFIAVIVGLAVLCLFLEIFVFNFKWLNSFGEETSVSKENIKILSGLSAEPDGAYKVTDKNAEIEINSLNRKIKYIYLNSGNADIAEIVISAKDEANISYLSAPSRTLCDKVERSKYIRLHFSGEISSLKITYKNIKDKVIRPGDIKLNAHVPLMFSPLRCFILWLILASLYILRPKSTIYSYKTDLKSRKQQIIAVILLVIMAVPFCKMINWNTVIRDTYKNNNSNHQYYELVEAFKNGKVDIGEANDALKKLDNPYAPSERGQKKVSFPWDRAYYNGKYYVYFGVVPAILLYLPYNLITGKNLPNYIALYIFGIMTMAGIMLLLWAIIKKWYQNTPFAIFLLLSIVFAASAGAITLVIQKPDLYLVPITSAIMMAVFALAFWILAADSEKISSWKLALGSLCAALIAGCRPQFLVVIFLGIIIFWSDVFKRRRLFSKSGIKQTAALCIPFAVVAAGIMWYNHARFGSPFDFGANYNLTTNDMTHRGFVVGRTGLGIFTYLLQPVRITSAFPFIQPISPAAEYQGLTLAEQVVGGVFWIFPITLFALCGCFIKNLFNDKCLKFLLICMVICSVVVSVLDAQMSGLLLRYLADYAWMLVLGAAIVIFAMYQKTSKNPQIRRILLSFVVVLSALTLISSFLLIFTTNVAAELKTTNPMVYYSAKHLIAFWI